jgi:excisionase family DNA binding protein
MNGIQKPLNVDQAAEFLGFKTSYVYNLVFYGKLKAYRPSGKKLFFILADLEAFAFSNEVGGYKERADSILNTAQKRKPRWKSKAGVTA